MVEDISSILCFWPAFLLTHFSLASGCTPARVARVRFEGLEFRVQGLGFRVLGVSSRKTVLNGLYGHVGLVSHQGRRAECCETDSSEAFLSGFRAHSLLHLYSLGKAASTKL